jgi:hypothetical protein
MKRLVIIAVVSFCMGASATKPTHITVGQVMPAYNIVAPNWQNAGLLSVGGIPTRNTQCGSTVSPSGLTPPTGGDDAALINAAITACAAGQVVKLAAGTFQLDQSEYIALNKGVTLRGTGGCTNASSPYCQTVINVYNGAIADWTISSSTAGANCGVNSGSTSTCTAATGVILVSPSSNFNWGWAGCFLGTTPTGCGTTLAADVAQGATTIQVAQTSHFSVGMWVLIDEDPQVGSVANPTGGANVQASSDWLNSSGSPATMRLEGGDIPTAYSFNANRVNAELHLITAIGAGPCPGTNCTLTFDDPVTLAFRQSGSHNAQVYWPTVQGPGANPFLTYAGVENLTITKAANGAVQFQFAAYSWMKNVEVGGWISGAANTYYAARIQIEYNYFHDCYDCENNGAEYPIGISSASTENYIVNNIVVRGGKGMVGRAANTAVVAYNYVDDTFYMASSIGDYWMDMDVNGSHYAGTHHFLFEGNWGDNCDSDETHGNAIYHTFFRNECTGIRTTFVDPSNGKTVNDSTGSCWGNASVAATCAPLRAAGPMAFDYWFAYVGNVLGLAGVTTTGNGWVYQGAFGGAGATNKCIWMSGWVGSEWPAPDPNLTTTTNPYIFRHGNYDYVSSAIADWATGYSHTLPKSFYVAQKPAFFSAGSCTYPWPWVTPDESTKIKSNSCSGSGLPALARWNAGTPFVQP